MMSMITFATFTADASARGIYTNRHRKKTSTEASTFSYLPLGGRFGIKSFCIASSGLRSHSGKLSSSGVLVVLRTLLYFPPCSHHSTHILTRFAMHRIVMHC